MKPCITGTLTALLLVPLLACNRTGDVETQTAESEVLEITDTPCDDHSDCPGEGHCFCDDRGNLVRATLDENGDGRPDRQTVMTYDAQNRRTSIEMDVRVDGTVDVRAAYSYDEAEAMTERWDRNNNGVFEATEVFDSDENLVRSETYDDDDGSLTRRCVYDPPCPSRHGGPGCAEECTDHTAPEELRRSLQ